MAAAVFILKQHEISQKCTRDKRHLTIAVEIVAKVEPIPIRVGTTFFAQLTTGCGSEFFHPADQLSILVTRCLEVGVATKLTTTAEECGTLDGEINFIGARRSDGNAWCEHGFASGKLPRSEDRVRIFDLPRVTVKPPLMHGRLVRTAFGASGAAKAKFVGKTRAFDGVNHFLAIRRTDFEK